MNLIDFKFSMSFQKLVVSKIPYRYCGDCADSRSYVSLTAFIQGTWFGPIGANLGRFDSIEVKELNRILWYEMGNSALDSTAAVILMSPLKNEEDKNRKTDVQCALR